MNDNTDEHTENSEEITQNSAAPHEPTPEELVALTHRIRKAIFNGIFPDYPHHSPNEATGFAGHAPRQP